MKFFLRSYDNSTKENLDCIVVLVFKPYLLSSSAEKLNTLSQGYIQRLIHSEDFSGNIGEKLLLFNVLNISSKRVLLIGGGENHKLEIYEYNKIISSCINILKDTNSKVIELNFQDVNLKNCDSIYWKIRFIIQVITESYYIFNKFKTNNFRINKSLQKVIFNVSSHENIDIGNKAIKHGLAILLAVTAVKDLSNMPPNVCNPFYLASKSKQLEYDYNNNIVTQIIDENEMKELGMNAYLAVAQGSRNKPYMSVIEYKGINQYHGDINPETICIIGKGVTFDSGGISIKPSEKMEEMKYDMCGAASVYGIMLMLAELKLSLNVIGILAGCENMPSGSSFKPGDIITTMSGKTVEVLNTDAEGRLVLCDVLTYARRFKPDVIIDIATLTGACVVALGEHAHGLMSNSDILAQELAEASYQSQDNAWRLPMFSEYNKHLYSNHADLSNTGDSKGAGAIVAACFLSNFIQHCKWAHLDIAGTAWTSGKKKGATGRPVFLLCQYLLNKCKAII